MKNLGQYFFVFLFLSININCDKSDEKILENPKDPETIIDDETPNGGGEEEYLTSVNIKVVLPENSTVNQSELFASTMFTTKSNVLNGSSEIAVFNGDAYELAIIEDLDGDIVLLKHLRASNDNEEIISSESTAISLIMFQSWVSNFAASAKEELITYVSSIPEYVSLVDAIDESLQSTGKPLNNPGVIDALNGLMEKLSGEPKTEQGLENSIFEIDEPLSLAALDGQITLENSSSLAYGVKLNDEETLYLEGIDKTVYSLVGNTIGSWITGEDNIQLTSISIPNLPDGYYDVYTGNGLLLPSIQSSNVGEDARTRNIAMITLSVINTFSGNLFKLADDKCLNSLGTFMINANAKLLEFQSVQSSSDYLSRVIETLLLSLDGFISLTSDCVSAKTLAKYGLQKALAVYNVINTVVTGYDTYNLISEAIEYEPEISFCVNNYEGNFRKCFPISASEEVSFGKIPNGLAGNDMITFENRSNNPVSIESINFPNEAYSMLPNIQNRSFNPGEKIELLITYDSSIDNGEEVYPILDSLEVETNFSEAPIFKIPINGEVINPLKITNLDGQTISEIHFPNTEVNTESESVAVKLTNTSDYSIVIPSSTEQINLNGFQSNWDEKVLSPGSEHLLYFTFNPSEDKFYEETIDLYTGTDQNISLTLFGEGFDWSTVLSGTWIIYNPSNNSQSWSGTCKSLNDETGELEPSSCDVSSSDLVLTFNTTNRTVSFDIFTTTYSISQDNVISFTFDIGNGIDDREVHSFWGQFIEDTGTFFGEYYTSYFETHDDGVVRYEDEAQGTAILSK